MTLPLTQIIALAIVQGFTEFLPISSSAHLIITSDILGWQNQGNTFDLALHVGTLLAVIIYFFKDIKILISDFFISIYKKKHYGQSKLAWLIAISTIPAAIFGFFLLPYIDSFLRDVKLIIFTTFFYAVILFIADYFGKKKHDIEDITLRKVIFIGIFQMLSLIPGTSRSGATITAGLLLGLTREAASKFSFLMAIPITLLAIIGKLSSDTITLKANTIAWVDFLIGSTISFITAIIVIHFFLKLLNRYGMLPYVIYRLALGFLLIYLVGFLS